MDELLQIIDESSTIETSAKEELIKVVHSTNSKELWIEKVFDLKEMMSENDYLRLCNVFKPARIPYEVLSIRNPEIDGFVFRPRQIGTDETVAILEDLEGDMGIIVTHMELRHLQRWNYFIRPDNNIAIAPIPWHVMTPAYILREQIVIDN